jgi:uncharacterized beta-barrel protein YwiB (DUF1934 family)
VALTLESRQDGDLSVSHHRGVLYRKPGAFYIQYEENGPDGEADAARGRTSVTLKADGGGLRMVRQGATEGTMTFAPGRKASGSLLTSVGRFRLDTETSRLHIEPDGRAKAEAPLPWRMEWAYRLWINEQYAGRFVLKLRIEEEKEP